MCFYERLTELMKENRIRQSDMTNDLGITSANFSIWRKGSTPRIATVKEIAEYFHVSTSYLLGTTDSKTEEVKLPRPPLVYEVEKARLIPIFSDIPDSDDIFQEQKYIDGQIYCSDNLKEVENLFAIMAIGSSMSPIIDAGDIVIAELTDFCHDGDMCIYKLYGNLNIRWLTETITEITLEPEDLYNVNNNPKGYKNITIQKDKLDDYDFSIIGKVVEVRKAARNLRRY